MKKLYFKLLVFFLLLTSINAQDTKIGRHTISEWHHLIDSTWGEGRTTLEKLQIFDYFWNTIDKNYAAFEGIQDNWQQLKSYRDTIANGVSRGRFSGILTHLVQSLHDGHVYMFDNIFGSTPIKKDVPILVPLAIDYPSFNWGTTDRFGAALTPLLDSTLLVYAVVKNHPLGLVPGDKVLGYDGRLWKDLYKELWKIQFPMNFFFVMSCSDAAIAHEWLGTAGLNWHLFDTIDIVKYATGDTVHLSTDLLSNPMPGIHATEQMPIKGVPFPDVKNGHHVSWGFIEGTKIGYIYVYGWHFLNSIDKDFLSAVNSFMPDSSSDGLIIDLRTNEGSDIERWTAGFRRLFNKDFEATKALKRASSNNHLDMKPAPEWDCYLINSDKQLYDRPIAVLCGPWTLSGGDFSVQLLRQHPMVNTFGRSTPGAFGPTVYTENGEILPTEWMSGLTVAVSYIPPNQNDRLYRRSIPVDKEVWLTPAGVANGEDDVVNSALNWINNLAYGHDIMLSSISLKPAIDTLKISALIENPNSHQTSTKVYIKNLEENFADSIELHKIGSSGKSETWSGEFLAPDSEDIFTISLTAKDIDESKTWTTSNISRFTTAGPVILDSISIKKSTHHPFAYEIKPSIKNESKSTAIMNVSVKLMSNDPWVTGTSLPAIDLPNINPGTSAEPSGSFQVHYIDSLFSGIFNFKVEIMSDGWVYWTDSMQVTIPGTGIDEQTNLPITFKLEQNYPNPFNPVTKIKYQIPHRSNVSLKVYDILGNKIAELVNEEKSSGVYEANWNAATLPSGVYFYQLKAAPNGGQAGDFIQTKKMILLK